MCGPNRRRNGTHGRRLGHDRRFSRPERAKCAAARHPPPVSGIKEGFHTVCQAEFPNEAACAAFLLGRRWPDGFVCPVCGKGRAAALKSRAYTYECSSCGRQTSITAGTAMHRTKLPLTTWFWAAHLMATHSNGMSARQLEDQLGLTYRTAW